VGSDVIGTSSKKATVELLTARASQAHRRVNASPLSLAPKAPEFDGVDQFVTTPLPLARRLQV
jgi:hypothetical protein